MAEEAKAEEKVVDEFALVKPDGGLAYPKYVGGKIENNKVVGGMVVHTPEEHKKWIKDNSKIEEQPKAEDKSIPAWGKK